MGWGGVGGFGGRHEEEGGWGEHKKEKETQALTSRGVSQRWLIESDQRKSLIFN